jgi:glutaminyl-peptide cyclotransferase
MKNYSSIISLFTLLLLTIACSETHTFILETPKKVSPNSSITLKLREANNLPIDSIHFFVNGQRIASTDNFAKFNTKNLGIGKHSVTALSFYPGKTNKKNGSFEIFPTEKPNIYTYKIINTYPHDTKAYTQGLEFHKGFLYETTGHRGQSTLRKVELETGKVLQSVDLSDTYFGEGMTIVDDKIFWLTWQNKKGFVYDLNTFEQEKEFKYGKSKQGWGLTHNETELIKSDGTHKIWFLDPSTQKEIRSIQVYTNDRALDNLNELEYINGKIYANKYLNSAIIIINPETGIAEGIVNLKGLTKEMEKAQKLKPEDEVLNGIAFDAKTNRLFVTGKNWSKLFEIELVQK